MKLVRSGFFLLLFVLLLSQNAGTLEQNDPANPVDHSITEKQTFAKGELTQQPKAITHQVGVTLDESRQSIERITIDKIGHLPDISSSAVIGNTFAKIDNKHIILPFSFAKADERIFFIHFDNDIFVEKDYYFTNGALVGMMDNRLKKLFADQIFPSLGNNTSHSYGFSLSQQMYTPINPETLTIVEGDRPFAGTLLLSIFRISQNAGKGQSLQSTLQLGVIGSASLASRFQEYMHDLYPAGWKYQIANDLLISYNMDFNQTVIQTDRLQLNLNAGLKAGTFQNKATLGVNFSFTPFSRHFKSRPQNGGNIPEISKFISNQSPLVIYGGINNHMVAYDATLSGGLFNKKSPYTIPGNHIKRMTLETYLGLAYTSGTRSIGIKLVYLSPEFKGGRAHQWGGISLAHIF